MISDELHDLVKGICLNQGENECIEFKHNNDDPEQIGEYISALANSAALHAKSKGYIVWGVDDHTRQVIGTKFLPRKKKCGNQELESWLLQLLTPGIEICFDEVLVDGLPVVVFTIQAAFSHPVRFKSNAFIRVGTYKKNLKEYPEKERRLWEIFQSMPFESGIAKEPLSEDQVFQELDYACYFELMEQPLPENRSFIIQRLKQEEIIQELGTGRFAITNLGAILFANDLEKFG